MHAHPRTHALSLMNSMTWMLEWKGSLIVARYKKTGRLKKKKNSKYLLSGRVIRSCRDESEDAVCCEPACQCRSCFQMLRTQIPQNCERDLEIVFAMYRKQHMLCCFVLAAGHVTTLFTRWEEKELLSAADIKGSNTGYWFVYDLFWGRFILLLMGAEKRGPRFIHQWSVLRWSMTRKTEAVLIILDCK